MIRLTELKLPLSALPAESCRAADAPSETEADRAGRCAHPVAALRDLAARALHLSASDIADLQVFKRSFDARKADIMAVYIVDVTLADPRRKRRCCNAWARTAYRPTRHGVPPGGAAPRQSLASSRASARWWSAFGPLRHVRALLLAQMGLKPIVIERGPTVRQRTQDTWGLWRRKTLNPEGNVQFGEGGAGTFSDGKLYSQIKDPRFLGRKVLHELVAFGAPSDILFEAHPHRHLQAGEGGGEFARAGPRLAVMCALTSV